MHLIFFGNIVKFREFSKNNFEKVFFFELRSEESEPSNHLFSEPISFSGSIEDNRAPIEGIASSESIPLLPQNEGMRENESRATSRGSSRANREMERRSPGEVSEGETVVSQFRFSRRQNNIDPYTGRKRFSITYSAILLAIFLIIMTFFGIVIHNKIKILINCQMFPQVGF